MRQTAHGAYRHAVHECVFYPFGGKALFDKASLTPVDEGKYIRILNPIGEELSLMNRSLVPNMLQCVSPQPYAQRSRPAAV